MVVAMSNDTTVIGPDGNELPQEIAQPLAEQAAEIIQQGDFTEGESTSD